jgi:hypothetical protein
MTSLRHQIDVKVTQETTMLVTMTHNEIEALMEQRIRRHRPRPRSH